MYCLGYIVSRTRIGIRIFRPDFQPLKSRHRKVIAEHVENDSFDLIWAHWYFLNHESWFQGDAECVLLHAAPALWVSQIRLSQFPLGRVSAPADAAFSFLDRASLSFSHVCPMSFVLSNSRLQATASRRHQCCCSH
jgi:hypothetical protein